MKGCRRSVRSPGRVHPQTRSTRVYARVPRQRIALIKFLFEGYDNLAYVSVIDRFQAVVRITCSRDSLSEVLQVCAGMQDFGLEVVSCPDQAQAQGQGEHKGEARGV